MIAVILLIAFLITGCEDKSVKTDPIIRIGVVTYTQDDPFINAMTDQLKEDLKKMIKTGETITIEAIPLTSENLADIRTLLHVFDLHYEEQILTVRCTGARHNLIRLLNYLQNQDISFGQVSSELPTLNDVFLEITGKQLRD